MTIPVIEKIEKLPEHQRPWGAKGRADLLNAREAEIAAELFGDWYTERDRTPELSLLLRCPQEYIHKDVEASRYEMSIAYAEPLSDEIETELRILRELGRVLYGFERAVEADGEKVEMFTLSEEDGDLAPIVCQMVKDGDDPWDIARVLARA